MSDWFPRAHLMRNDSINLYYDEGDLEEIQLLNISDCIYVRNALLPAYARFLLCVQIMYESWYDSIKQLFEQFQKVVLCSMRQFICIFHEDITKQNKCYFFVLFVPALPTSVLYPRHVHHLHLISNEKKALAKPFTKQCYCHHSNAVPSSGKYCWTMSSACSRLFTFNSVSNKSAGICSRPFIWLRSANWRINSCTIER